MEQFRALYLLPQRGRESTGHVSGFGERPGEFHIQVAQSDLGEVMTGICGVDQVGVEHDVMLHSLDIAGDPPQRQLVIMKNLGNALVSQNVFDLRCQSVLAKIYCEGTARFRCDGNANLRADLCSFYWIRSRVPKSVQQWLVGLGR